MTPLVAALLIFDIISGTAFLASSVFFPDISFSKFFASVFNSCFVATFLKCLTRDFLKSLKLDLLIGNFCFLQFYEVKLILRTRRIGAVEGPGSMVAYYIMPNLQRQERLIWIKMD